MQDWIKKDREISARIAAAIASNCDSETLRILASLAKAHYLLMPRA